MHLHQKGPLQMTPDSAPTPVITADGTLLLATDYEDLRRRHARFTALYGLWSHAISARAPAQDEAAPLPCLLLAQGTAAVHLMDPEYWRGWISTDPATLRRWQERADALLQRSQAAFPVTTLGL